MPAAYELNVTSLIDQLRARRWLVLAIFLVVTALAAAAAFLMTPVYRSTATLIAANDSGAASAGLSSMLGDVGSLASLAGVNIGSDQSKVEAEALLQSRQFTESFIDDNQLLPELFADRWDIQRKSWILSWRHPQPPTLYDGFQLFDDEIRSITEDKKTGIVTLDIDWTDREEGARWANELVHRLNEAMRQRAIREAEASIDLLTTQLQAASQVELQQSISRGIESYIKQRTLASVRPEYAFRVIDPAKAPDADEFIRPSRSMYLVFGPLIGLMLAVLAILGLGALQRGIR
jgi:uncharacterized protein involved in exopolysaccharide biosynthesis